MPISLIVEKKSNVSGKCPPSKLEVQRRQLGGLQAKVNSLTSDLTATREALRTAEEQLTAARETNRSFHRRVQRAERQVRREPSQQAFWWSQRQTRRWLLFAMDTFDKLRDAEAKLASVGLSAGEGDAESAASREDV